MRLRKANKGAVLAEFIIAFMPICAMFLCVAQLSRYAIARMALMHAAEVSVRACAVIADPNPGHDSGLNGPDDDYKLAARLAMAPFGDKGIVGLPSGHEIRMLDPTCTHTGEANGGLDTVKIDALYTCTVPLAKNIVCSAGIPFVSASVPKTVHIEASFPHQGAEYKLGSSQ